jgi:hypothetical protein
MVAIIVFSAVDLLTKGMAVAAVSLVAYLWWLGIKERRQRLKDEQKLKERRRKAKENLPPELR